MVSCIFIPFRVKHQNISNLPHSKFYQIFSGKSYYQMRRITNSSNANNKENRMIFKWLKPMSFAILGCICYSQFFHVVEREQKKYDMNLQLEGINIKLYKLLPLNTLSRIWKAVNDVSLPIFLRGPVLKLYSNIFGCDINEAVIREWKHYRCLGEFFRRKIRMELRPIDDSAELISPSDGRILHFGPCVNGYLEQVKGVNYKLGSFLGSIDDKFGYRLQNVNFSNNNNNWTITNNNNQLFHCTIYLAPGDYHRFHSPTDWEIYFRRHFPGKLLSVSPIVAKNIKGLFSINERVVYYGKWKHGLFIMSPVGATNVGNIKIYMDNTLSTNKPKHKLNKNNLDLIFPQHACKKGEMFGEFNLGSSIILIFEAPKDFQFTVQPGDKIRMGQKLGMQTTNS